MTEQPHLRFNLQQLKIWTKLINIILPISKIVLPPATRLSANIRISGYIFGHIAFPDNSVLIKCGLTFFETSRSPQNVSNQRLPKKYSDPYGLILLSIINMQKTLPFSWKFGVMNWIVAMILSFIFLNFDYCTLWLNSNWYKSTDRWKFRSLGDQ